MAVNVVRLINYILYHPIPGTNSQYQCIEKILSTLLKSIVAPNLYQFLSCIATKTIFFSDILKIGTNLNLSKNKKSIRGPTD